MNTYAILDNTVCFDLIKPTVSTNRAPAFQQNNAYYTCGVEAFLLQNNAINDVRFITNTIADIVRKKAIEMPLFNTQTLTINGEPMLLVDNSVFISLMLLEEY